jgi:hypothetical protein
MQYIHGVVSSTASFGALVTEILRIKFRGMISGGNSLGSLYAVRKPSRKRQIK